MKNILSLLFFFVSLNTSVSGQDKNYTNCEKHFFKNGKISTQICFDENKHWGKATAYDNKGDNIYERNLRRVAGHASVHFSYYPSGAVSKAEFSDAPDAGIQWYQETITFSEDGKITGKTSQSNDDLLYPSIPKYYRPEVVNPSKDSTRPKHQMEPIPCQQMNSNEIWVRNASKFKVAVNAIRKNDSKEFHSIALAPGDTGKLAIYSMGEKFYDPSELYDFTVGVFKKGSVTKLTFVKGAIAYREVSTSCRRYYYMIR